MEGDSVTLNTGVEIKQEDIKWYFNDILIAEITGDQSKICTDVQCEERFSDRLKLDHQTGSLNITNTTTTDSGLYELEISSSSSIRGNIFIVTVHDRVSVMEEDSVTLNTGVQTNQQDRIRWYFNDIRIAQINRDQSKICTDVQCNDDTERFRDRLKLDHQTGSLTIMNITDTDSGVYQLQISSGSSDNEKTFNVILKTVMEGEPVILYTGVIRKLNDSIIWYLNEIIIAEVCEPNKACTDVDCDERFKDRLKLDHQTGSLTITNTRNTDSGEYKLQINNSRFSIIRRYSVSVTAVPGSGLSSAAIGVICAAAAAGGAVLLVAAAAVIYCHCRSKQNGKYYIQLIFQNIRFIVHKESLKMYKRNWTLRHDYDQEGAANGTSTGQTDGPLTGADNEIPQ
ncbi:unnamed protein product [Leuciscus chuanchicus]